MGYCFFQPQPKADAASALVIYRHVLVVCFLLTVAWAWFCLRWRTLWAAEIVETYRRAHNDKSPSQLYLREVHGISALGARGVAYLVFFAPELNSPAFTTVTWSAFCIPLLATFSFFWFVTLAAFQRLIRPPIL